MNKQQIENILSNHAHQVERYDLSYNGTQISIVKKDDGTGSNKIVVWAFSRWWDLPAKTLDTSSVGINTGVVGGYSSGDQVYAFFNETETRFLGYGLLPTEGDPTLVSSKYKKLKTLNINVGVGMIGALHKSFTGNNVYITDEWVECNGQTLSDNASIFDGNTIPDLNGDARFLRGSSTSGTEQSHALQYHEHLASFAAGTASGTATFTPATTRSATAPGPRTDSITSNPFHDPVQIAEETRPINMSVVWIMGVK